MKAMILAAGRGTRLHPHTLERPKALVEVGCKPLIGYVVDKLIASGFDDIVVNVHHFAPMIIEYLNQHSAKDCITISDESERLLDTGGGILKARKFLDGKEPFLIHNVDILSDIDLSKLMAWHKERNPIASLAVGKRESLRYFLFNEEMRLAGWRNSITNKEIITTKDSSALTDYAFAGIHVISPEFFSLIRKIGPFSIVEAYLSLCSTYPLYGFDTSDNFVLDVGKPQNLEKANGFIERVSQIC